MILDGYVLPILLEFSFDQCDASTARTFVRAATETALCCIRFGEENKCEHDADLN